MNQRGVYFWGGKIKACNNIARRLALFVSGQRDSAMFRVMILALFSASVAFAVSPSKRTIEDKDLSPVSSAVEKAIRSHAQGREYADCQFEGAPLHPPNEIDKEVFVTTSNVCNWGAAQGPILILNEKNGAFVVLLHTVGHSVEAYSVNGLQHHALRVFGVHSITEYRFDAGHYIKVKTTFDR